MSEEGKPKKKQTKRNPDKPIPETAEVAAKTYPWMGQYNQQIPKQLLEYLAKGFSFESFGAEVNVGRSTLYRWVDEYPEFKEAKEAGESKGLRLIESIALSKIKGRVGKDEKTGKEIFNPKLSDSGMVTFLLKTRFHKVYGEKKEVDHKSSDGSMTPTFIYEEVEPDEED